jgi:CheY-like chemotaxis protein
MPLPEDMVILLVEDREDDVILIRRALLQAKIHNPFFVVGDGEQALSYLQGLGKYADRAQFPLPDLVLLDLKLPRVDGFEILQWVRSQPAFKTLRIIVLTSSQDIFDINRAYVLGANSFLVKPSDFQDYNAMMRTLALFWLRYSQAPQLAAGPTLVHPANRAPAARPDSPSSANKMPLPSEAP